jgi:hypothetical protein
MAPRGFAGITLICRRRGDPALLPAVAMMRTTNRCCRTLGGRPSRLAQARGLGRAGGRLLAPDPRPACDVAGESALTLALALLVLPVLLLRRWLDAALALERVLARAPQSARAPRPDALPAQEQALLRAPVLVRALEPAQVLAQGQVPGRAHMFVWAPAPRCGPPRSKRLALPVRRLPT